MTNFFKSLSAFALAVGVASSVMAQSSYYDDDIYFNPDKVKTQTPVKKKNSKTSTVVIPLPGSDTYIVNTGSNRNVDEYNRRTQRVVITTDSGSVSSQSGAFPLTRRIERFSNPDIISGSSDSDLQDIYYYSLDGQAAPSTTTVNVYINDNSYYDPWYSPWWGWNSPWYYSSRWNNPWYWNSAWAWNDPWYWNTPWGWNDPWYIGTGWGWGGPSWSWSWGFGPSWGWGPAIVVPDRPHRNPVGAMATHRPSSSSSNRYTPAVGGQRPGFSAGRRPSAVQNTPSGTSNQQRPASSENGQRRPLNNNTYQSNNYNYSNPVNNNNSSWGISNNNSGSRGGGFSTGGSGSRGSGGRRR